MLKLFLCVIQYHRWMPCKLEKMSSVYMGSINISGMNVFAKYEVFFILSQSILSSVALSPKNDSPKFQPNDNILSLGKFNLLTILY